MAAEKWLVIILSRLNAPTNLIKSEWELNFWKPHFDKIALTELVTERRLHEKKQSLFTHLKEANSPTNVDERLACT